MPRLTIAAQAQADLQEIFNYVAQDHPEAARRVLQRLRVAARQLAQHPRMGRNRSEDLRCGLYSFPVGAYVLFYREQPGGIALVRVIHGSRDLLKLF
jgi:toxin ParE1/3/4